MLRQDGHTDRLAGVALTYCCSKHQQQVAYCCSACSVRCVQATTDFRYICQEASQPPTNKHEETEEIIQPFSQPLFVLR